jgi:hypothetical protein
MKKFISILIIVASLVSCKKSYLDEQQVSVLTQDYFNSEKGLESLINGLYEYARFKHRFGDSGGGAVLLLDPETDQYMNASLPMAQFSSAAYGTDVSTVSINIMHVIGAINVGTAGYAPTGAYPHINNCNIALEQIESVKPGKFGTDEVFANSRKAEVLMLRAWAYYIVSNQLGDVPLLLKAKRKDTGIYYYPKAKLEDIYTQIISDMRFAYQNLPSTQSNQGRLTKWAAGHFLAKLYLNRAQAANFQNSNREELQRLYKGNVSTDLDSVISITTDVINAGTAKAGTYKGLAADYWSLFDPKISESTPSSEVLWAAQYDINTSLNGSIPGNRVASYHIGNYTTQTGVKTNMAYGLSLSPLKPTDWGYDNFRDKVNDSRYYKTFQYEYISNMSASTSTSFSWNTKAAAWWNANKPAGEPTVLSTQKRIIEGKRALIYLENQKDEALDSLMVYSQPYQFLVRWVKSATTGKYYYRIFVNNSSMALNGSIYLSSKKFIDPNRGGSADEANANVKAGTRDNILMRLAETYLIRAEAYGRKGIYNLAVTDINVLRERAAYKAGENRPEVCAKFEPQAASLPVSDRTAPYLATGNPTTAILVSELNFTPGTAEANKEKYIPTVTTKNDMFIHFIYNEKAREFLSEGISWEDQHNAGILYDRAVYLNQMVSDKSGLWPAAANSSAIVPGQDGNGKGFMKPFQTFRFWPRSYLDLLTDADGIPLDEAAKKAYQNSGY